MCISKTLILFKHIKSKSIIKPFLESVKKFRGEYNVTFCLPFVLEKVDKHLSCADGATLQEKLTGFFLFQTLSTLWSTGCIYRFAYEANYDGV